MNENNQQPKNKLSQEGIEKMKFFLTQCEQIITQLRLDINEIKNELKTMEEQQQSTELITETQNRLHQLESNCTLIENPYNSVLSQHSDSSN